MICGQADSEFRLDLIAYLRSAATGSACGAACALRRRVGGMGRSGSEHPRYNPGLHRLFEGGLLVLGACVARKEPS